MKRRRARCSGVIAVIVVAIGAQGTRIWAADPVALNDRGAALMAVAKVIEEEKLFASAESRQAGTAAAMAAMDRVLALNQQEMQAGRLAKEAVVQWQAIMHIRKLALDDPAARRANERALASGGRDAAMAAVCQAAAKYLKAPQEEASQVQAIDALEQAFKKVQADGTLQFLQQIFYDSPPATAGVAKRIAAFLRAAPESLHWRAFLESGLGPVGEMEARARRMEIMDRPLTLEGTLADGSAFSTARWKGKVVLVDFWSSTCAPCIAALPELARLYGANHAKGLEMLSISADEDAAKFKAFLAKHPQAVWPQMYSAPPLTQPMGLGFGVNHWPTVFLIDRKGVLRFVNEEDVAGTVAKLLAEGA